MLFVTIIFAPLATALIATEMVDDTARIAANADVPSASETMDEKSVLPSYVYYGNADYVFPYNNYYLAKYYDRSEPVIPAPYYGSYKGDVPLYEGYQILAKDREPKEVVAALKISETDNHEDINHVDKHPKLEGFLDNKAIPIY